MAHARSAKIHSAMNMAKVRDGYTCKVCGRAKIDGHVIIGSHLFPRNVQDPADSKLIVSLCFWCDKQFDSIHNLRKRAQWLRDHGLSKFADRMAKLDGRCAG